MDLHLDKEYNGSDEVNTVIGVFTKTSRLGVQLLEVNAPLYYRPHREMEPSDALQG